MNVVLLMCAADDAMGRLSSSADDAAMMGVLACVRVCDSSVYGVESAMVRVSV